MAASSSFLVPRDITKTGKVTPDIWLVGTVVRIREFKGGAQDNAKGKGKSKKTGKAKQSNGGMEIHLCGGDTPADVIVLQAWDEQAKKNLKPFFEKSKKIMISGAYIKEHTEKLRTG